MWKMKASTGFAALGCLLLLWTPMQAGDKGQPVAKEPGQAGEELIDLTGTGPNRSRMVGKQGPTGTEPGILPTSKASNLYLVDGAGAAGTIYAYNYELRQIITSFPTPEAADGGPLACVQEGDEIELDVAGRRLELRVTDDELERRARQWQPPRPAMASGSRIAGAAPTSCPWGPRRSQAPRFPSTASLPPVSSASTASPPIRWTRSAIATLPSSSARLRVSP